MFCAQCGTDNNDGAAFCKSCGAPLTATPSAAPTQPTAMPMGSTMPAGGAGATPGVYPQPAKRPVYPAKYFAFIDLLFILGTFLAWFHVSLGNLADFAYTGSNTGYIAFWGAVKGLVGMDLTPLGFFGFTGDLNTLANAVIGTMGSMSTSQMVLVNQIQSAAGLLGTLGIICLLLWIASVVLLAIDAYLRFTGKKGTFIPYIVVAVFALFSIVVGFSIDGAITSSLGQMLGSSSQYVAMPSLFGVTFWPWLVLAFAVVTFFYCFKNKA